MGGTIVRFQVSPDVVIRDIAAGLMLVNVRTGFAWTLNQVGAHVCRRLDGVTETSSIVDELNRIYGVGPHQLLSDVTSLLAQLEDEGLIRRVLDR
jgi:hypothetical protein